MHPCIWVGLSLAGCQCELSNCTAHLCSPRGFPSFLTISFMLSHNPASFIPSAEGGVWWGAMVMSYQGLLYLLSPMSQSP